jgi:hypothetical protein
MGAQTIPHNVKNFAMFILGVCAWCGLCQFHIDYKFIHGKVILPEMNSSRLPHYGQDSNLSTVNRNFTTVPELAAMIVDVFVSVHSPKFPFMLSFHKSFSECKLAWDQMKLVLVFSTTSEALDYERLLNTTCPVCSVAYSVLVAPEWTAQGHVFSIPALKKMFGPSSSLDVGKLSSYFLMMDCEVQLICQNWGPASLYDRIHRKSQNKTWVAGDPSPFTSHITRNVDIMRRTMSLSFTEEDIIRQGTSGFRYYSWWTDLPWYDRNHFGSMLKRMNPGRNESYVSLLQQLHNSVRESWIFEQLVYQYWTLIQYGYKFDLKHCKCVGVGSQDVHHGCISMNEGLMDLLISTDKVCRQTTHDFISTSPLWIPCNAVKF